MKVKLNGKPFSYAVDGRSAYGSEEVLLEQDEDLLSKTPWADRGYGVVPFLAPPLVERLRRGIRSMVKGFLEEIGIRKLGRFDLEKYHAFLKDPAGNHQRITERIRNGFPLEMFPIPFKQVTDRIGEICRVPLQPRNPMTKAELFCIRIIRPGTNDFNPPHRDVWLDRLRNAVNLYVPIAGSNERSSLPLVTGSHRWKESEIQRTSRGAQVNGVSYTVPAVTGAKKKIRMIRPNPAGNEVLVFSPYLIHGGAANLNPDTTRVSLEIRLWRRRS